MLADGRLDAEATEKATAAILRNAIAQIQLVDDLLDISRIIAGKLVVDLRPVDVNPVVESALDAIRPSAALKEIDLEVRLDPRPSLIEGESQRLQQVVWNVLANAVKSTPRHGRVRVDLRQTDQQVIRP